jgi:DNA-binding winged helix-turn-helix (wHTH) protein/tetratricopeptide (TPR) repeat protein
VLQVLRQLATRQGQTVSNEELLRAVWPEETVTGASIKRAIRGARKALGDDGESQRSIRTVRGRGYQLVLPVTIRDTAAVDAGTEKSATASPPRGVNPSGAIAPPPDRHSTPSAGGGFVGRRGVLALLDAQLRDALRGYTQCVLLIGEPGIGKTATLAELGRRASEAGADAWFARCIEEEGAPAFWPWTQVMRSCQASRGGDELREFMGTSAADIAEGIPLLRQWMSDVPQAPVVDHNSARFRFFDAVTLFLNRATEKKPVVLLFDDLQRADEPTLRLLSFVLRHTDNSRLMIALSSRPVPVKAPSGELLTAFIQEVPATCIELDGLDRKDVGGFVELRTGRSAPDVFISRLHALTAGNPLFLQHVLHGWQTAGQLDGAVDWTKLVTRSEPQGLTGAIARVLGDLDPSSRHLLGLAALLGTEFTVGRLALLAEKDSLLVLPSLAAARAAGVVREAASGGGVYHFTHVLIRDALYAALPSEERSRLHARAAASLEASYIASEAMLSELAYHFGQAWPAHDDGRAFAYTVRAAETAERRLAYEEAAKLFDRALQISAAKDTADPGQRMRLLLKKGEALSHAADAEKARLVLLEAIELARALGDRDELAHAVTLLAQAPELGDVDVENIDLLREVLAVLPGEDPRRPFLSALLAKCLTYSIDSHDRTTLALKAIVDAKELSDPMLKANTLHQCHRALAEPVHLAVRESVAEDLQRLGQLHGDHRISWHAATALLQNSLERGDFVGVDRAIGAMEILANHAREPLYRWYLALFRGMRSYVAGSIREAEQFALQAFELGACVGETTAREAYCMQVCGWLRIMSRSAECESLAREMTLRYPTLTGWRVQLAAAGVDLGRTDLARQTLAQVMEDRRLIHDPFTLGMLCGLADLGAYFATKETARSLYALLEPHAELWGSSAFGLNTFGPVHRLLGLLAMQGGDLDAADVHLERALAMCEAADSGMFTSLTCIASARVALKRRDVSSARRASDFLARSDGLNVRHGLSGLTFTVRFMCERAGLPVPAPTSRA